MTRTLGKEVLKRSKYLQNGLLGYYLNCVTFFLIRVVLWIG